MKKALKIVGIILGALVLLALIVTAVVAIFFPGLPVYFTVKSTCPRIDVTAEAYPYSLDMDIDEDWYEISANGLAMMVPSDMQRKEDTPEHTYVYVYREGSEAHAGVLFMGPEENTDYIMSMDEEETILTQEQFAAFCAEVGAEEVEGWVALTELCLNLTMDDLDITDRKNAEAFAYFAMVKEVMFYDYLGHYRIDTEDYYGYITVIREPDAENDRYGWVIDIQPRENDGYSYSVLITSTEEEMLAAIASTVRLAEWTPEEATE